ncbi:SNF2 family N-terminal domain-containing protein [Xylariaceae sp. FL1651]|nr:SNF2 family N-terminal domain-containing protein [Xylariaceae sp. FL1651]
MFLLYDQNSDLHLGTLYNPRLIGALCELPLRLDATLFISEVKHIKEKRRPQMRKYVSTEATRGYSIRIVLHGLRIDKDTVGDLLSDAGFFLQHPYAAEVIPGIQYDNPHYLVRPGTGMPKLEQLHLHGMNESITQTEVRDEIAKSYFIRIFETAEADGDAVTVINTSLSPRLRSTLMRHQVLALAMMQEKESGFLEEPMFPSLWRRESSKNSKNSYYRHDITRLLEHRPIPAMGGILADDMGLGKSLSMLALICSSLDFNSMTIHRNQNERHQGTLIVAPKSTIYGWVAQIKEHIHEGQLRVIIYHGSDRQSLADQFRDVDVVITTYQTIRTEWAAKGATNPLFSWKWLRVVLDEGKVQYVMGLLQLIDLAAAHHIRNRSQQAFQSVCDLVSQYRWCLTGTPIHNSLDDYGALLSFIRVFPFIQKSKFVCWIVKPVEEKHSLGVERLQRLIRATCLRRMKEKILSSNDLKLPLRSEMIHEIYLHQDDKDLYDAIKKLCAETAAGLDERPEAGLLPKGKGKNILLLINSLRLICNHGERLLPDKMKRLREENSVSCFESGMKQVYSARCSVCDGEIDDDVTRTEDQDPICFNCVDSEVDSHIIGMKGDLLGKRSISDYRPSAKVLALLENLKGEQTAARYNHKSRKSVVFSVWVKMLDLVAQALHQEGFVFQRIDGQTSLEGRRKAMQEFEANPDCTVLLASIGSCAEGVNITAACIVHLLEPHWNPMVETQAIDRVYRIGQTQDVTVIRYIVPNSVETYIQEVQQEKKQLIDRAINIDGVTGGDVESKRWQRMKEILAEVPG